jgi:ParB-like chromosome segregation protein Spo0J
VNVEPVKLWAVELVPIERIQTHPRNYREHDLGSIHVSIERFSNYLPLVVQRSTGYVLAGNGRLIAERQRGTTEVPVRWLDVSDAEAEAILLADNWIPRRARDMDQELLDLMLSLREEDAGLFEATGVEDEDVEALERELAEADKPLKLDSRKMTKPKKKLVCPECGHKWEQG